MFTVTAGRIEIFQNVTPYNSGSPVFHSGKGRNFREHRAEDKWNQAPLPHMMIIRPVTILVKPAELDSQKPDSFQNFEGKRIGNLIRNPRVEKAGVDHCQPANAHDVPVFGVLEPVGRRFCVNDTQWVGAEINLKKFFEKIQDFRISGFMVQDTQGFEKLSANHHV